MRQRFTTFRSAPAIAALLAASLSACMSSAEQRHVEFQEDSGTCDRFGARRGSSAYSDCMLTQQQRRDDKQLRALESARIASELARDGQIMAERARRDRCRRNPDRKECGR